MADDEPTRFSELTDDERLVIEFSRSLSVGGAAAYLRCLERSAFEKVPVRAAWGAFQAEIDALRAEENVA